MQAASHRVNQLPANNDHKPVNIDALMNGQNVVILLNLRAVSLYVIPLLNIIHLFQLNIHTRANAYGKEPARF